MASKSAAKSTTAPALATTTGAASSSSAAAASDPTAAVPTATIVGTGMARFLNEYTAAHDRPFERLGMNRDVVLDDELSRLLEEERRSGAFKAHNKKKDWIKHYMDECVKFQSITKGGKK